MLTVRQFDEYLVDCSELVRVALREIVPADNAHTGGLYKAMLEYPLRHGKGLRPALCIATCLAEGGTRGEVLRSAAVLELYHNAFLVHDDVEDGSEKRRNEATLHRQYGVPIAVNVGDGMLAAALQPLLDNIEQLGLGAALRVLDIISRMSRETAEGQMMELAWIRDNDCIPTRAQVTRMLFKKTAWYSFIAPMLIGATVAGSDEERLAKLFRLALHLGIAFQIVDDLLNLEAEESIYGKELAGDLWEGKRTLMLTEAMRRSDTKECQRAFQILGKARPELEGEKRNAVSAADAGFRSNEDVEYLDALIIKYDGMNFARSIAQSHIRKAQRTFSQIWCSDDPTPHELFIHRLINYVYERSR